MRHVIPFVPLLVAAGCAYEGSGDLEDLQDLDECTQMVVVEGVATLDLQEGESNPRWTGTEVYHTYALDSGEELLLGSTNFTTEGDVISPEEDLAEASLVTIHLVETFVDTTGGDVESSVPNETTYTYDRDNDVIRVERDVLDEDGSYLHKMEVSALNSRDTVDGVVLSFEYTDTYYLAADGGSCDLGDGGAGTDGWGVAGCGGPTLKGIDISKWQSTIDWDSVVRDGVEFAFIRVSDGVYVEDDRFDYNWSEARDVGIIRGAYQFFRPTQSATEQANLLLDMMGALQPNDLPPVLDVEVADGASSAEIVASIREWLDVVEAEIGRQPIIYTSVGFWDGTVGASDAFSSYPLWVAHWGVDCPTLPVAWDGWLFWQSSETGAVDGIYSNVDTDLFNGTWDDLIAFAN